MGGKLAKRMKQWNWYRIAAAFVSALAFSLAVAAMASARCVCAALYGVCV